MNNLVDEVIEVLQVFKNAVIEGPPGTGKTFVVKEIADAWQKRTGRALEGTGNGAYAITFHPSTSYEDFIEGLRFSETTKAFAPKDGFLKRAIEHATDNPHSDFLVLLDELNRANVPKVLGDVLVCMEASKRSHWSAASNEWEGGFSVTLPYSGDPFSIPDNLYILGTMNTSDRSITPLDSALRRRFAFVRAEALPTAALRAAIVEVNGEEDAQLAESSINALSNLNALLAAELGPDALLGHSYLFDIRSKSTAKAVSPQDAVSNLIADAGEYDRAFWLQVSEKRSGASASQINLPESNPGIVDQFYPLAGHAEKLRGQRVEFTMRWDGKDWVGNVIGHNDGGKNWKLQLQGETENERLSTYGEGFLGKTLVWFISGDTVTMHAMEGTRSVLDALSAASGTNVYATRAPEGSRRMYGFLEPWDNIETTPPKATSTLALVWRYSILPQLLDTAAQLGGVTLFDDNSGSSDLRDPESAERIADFVEFLAGLGLKLASRGHGLGQLLSVEDVPILKVSVAAESNEKDDEGVDADDLAETASTDPATEA